MGSQASLTVVSADEAPLKKPHPQAYLLALRALQLRSHEAVAMEDAPAGLAAAQAAGIARDRDAQLLLSRDRDPRRLGRRPIARSDGRAGIPAAEPRAVRIDLAQITPLAFERDKAVR
jgi:hypothetical protein